MLQRIRQLDSRAGQERVPFHEAGRERCRSYLAAINALYLVDRDDAWLAVPSTSLDYTAKRGPEEASLPPGPKRRRLAASGKHLVVDHIPDEARSEGHGGRVDVVTLEMLREEYTLALAKLSLAPAFSELGRAGAWRRIWRCCACSDMHAQTSTWIPRASSRFTPRRAPCRAPLRSPRPSTPT
jgi:hypothetical protein